VLLVLGYVSNSSDERGGTGQSKAKGTVDRINLIHPYSIGRFVLLTWTGSSHYAILFVQASSLQTLQQIFSLRIRGCHSSAAASTTTLRECLDPSSSPGLASSSRPARRRRHGCESSPTSSICAIEELCLGNRPLRVKLARWIGKLSLEKDTIGFV